MKMTEKQRKALKLIGGERLLLLVEEVGEKATDRLEKSGVDYKARRPGGGLAKLTARQLSALEAVGGPGLLMQLDALDEQIDQVCSELESVRRGAKAAIGQPADVHLSDIVQDMLMSKDPLARAALKGLAYSDEMTPAASQTWQRRQGAGYARALEERNLEGQKEMSSFARELAKLRRARKREAADYASNRSLPDVALGEKSAGQSDVKIAGFLDPDAMGLLSAKAKQAGKGSAPRDRSGYPMVFKAGRWQRMTQQERESFDAKQHKRDMIDREARKKKARV